MYWYGKKPVLTVTKEKEPSAVPLIDSIVIGKVIRVNPRFASVKIMCCDDKVLKEGYSGIIRYFSLDTPLVEIDILILTF